MPGREVWRVAGFGLEPAFEDEEGGGPGKGIILLEAEADGGGGMDFGGVLGLFSTELAEVEEFCRQY